MYAGKVPTVPLPTTGRVHVLKNGYVYWASETKWSPDLKRPVDNRRAVGKLDPDDPTRMYPNRTYHELFDKGQVPARFSVALSYGEYMGLMSAAERVGCLEALNQSFPDLRDKILALAVHAACAGESTAQHVGYWCYRNYCGLERPLSSQEISNVYAEIGGRLDDVARFLSSYRDAYHARMSPAGITCVALDSTSQSTTSSDPRAEHGHAKQNPGVPQINTAMFTDEETGIPLFYEHFMGSVLDKSETPYTIEKAEALGFRKLFVMMDRGCFSQSTARALSDLEFGIMSPSNARVATTLLEEHRDEVFNQEARYIPGADIYGMHVPDVEVFGGRYDGYLFYDRNRANNECNHIHRRLEFITSTVLSRKRFTEKLKRKYEPWLEITKAPRDPGTGRDFTVVRNAAAVQAELLNAGFFVVVSNAGLSAPDMIRIARMRDTDEKSFRRMKSHFELTSPYTHGMTTYDGKMFVAFVALVITEAFRWFTRGALSGSSATVATKLFELCQYEIIEKEPGVWMPVRAATRKQKEIWETLGLTEQIVEARARQVHLLV